MNFFPKINYIWKIFKEAGGVFVNIRAAEMDMSEFNQVCDVIHEFADKETLVKIVTTVDDGLGDEMVVTVIAADNVFYLGDGFECPFTQTLG